MAQGMWVSQVGGSQGRTRREFHSSSSPANTPLVKLDKVEFRQVDTTHSRTHTTAQVFCWLVLRMGFQSWVNLVSYESSEKNRVKRGVQILGLSLQKECSWSANPGFEEGYEHKATGRLRCSHQIYFH